MKIGKCLAFFPIALDKKEGNVRLIKNILNLKNWNRIKERGRRFGVSSHICMFLQSLSTSSFCGFAIFRVLMLHHPSCSNHQGQVLMLTWPWSLVKPATCQQHCSHSIDSVKELLHSSNLKIASLVAINLKPSLFCLDLPASACNLPATPVYCKCVFLREKGGEGGRCFMACAHDHLLLFLFIIVVTQSYGTVGF